MSRRLLASTFVLGVLAAACSAPPKATVSFGSGKEFVPQVADFLDNTGVDPSIAVASDGTPYVVSFAFLEQLAQGQTAPTRPIGTPSLPSVGLVSVKDGIWTRGGVAMQADIANADVPFTPAAVANLKTMTATSVNGTAVVADAQGHLHVAWAADSGLWYADDTSGGFAATQILKEDPALTEAGPLGAPSVAVLPDGMAWVAYTVATATGQRVTAASNVSGQWQSQTVATIPLCQGCPQPYRTAVAVLGDGTPIVVYSDGKSVFAATPREPASKHPAWKVSTVESGADGYGLSISVDPAGDPHVAYYAGSEVHAARSSGGGPWQVTKVADVGSGANEAGRATGVAAVDATTVYVTWYDPGTDSVGLAVGDGSYSAIPVSGTGGGDSPAVAATSDGATVYLTWYDEVNQNLDLGMYGEVSGLAVANPSPTQTGAPSAAPPPSQECSSVKNGQITIVAQGIAFDTSCIQVTPGTAFTVHFENKDAGVPHNFALYTDSSGTTPLAPAGQIITGPATADYKIAAQKPGTYLFRCDVHPTSMFGQFIVK